MNSLVEAKVYDYLRIWLRLNPNDCGTVVQQMRAQAMAAGHELDARFAASGLGVGPEARTAASIVERALLGGGCETSDYTIRNEIQKWLRTNPVKGKY